MMLNSLLDDIKKRIKLGKSVATTASLESSVHEFLKLVPLAEKFDFGLLQVEFVEDRPLMNGGRLPMFRLPTVTEDEIDFWFEGLIPLPSDCCWFEFKVSNEQGLDAISGLLVQKRADGSIWSQRIECATSKDKDYMIDGTWSSLTIDRTVKIVNSDKDRDAQIKRLHPKRRMEMFGTSALMTVYFCLMINSKTTELRKVVPSKDQQSLRRQLKKEPLPNHTVVTIVPKRYINEAKDVAREKGTHASPRLHWRRSHLRIFHRGTDKERRIVISRHLVGRRELGEVTHDYMVRMK